MEKAIKRAQVLIEALPYIREFFGKTIVIKLGGQAMEKGGITRSIAEDIVLMRYVGIKPVVVHGGGEAISGLMQKLGIKPKFIEGNRVTDKATMEVVEMVLAGKINKEIVALLNSCGGKAVGVEGKDGKLIVAKKISEEKLGLVGEVEKINPEILEILEKEGFIPVIAPVGTSKEDESLNINADAVAAEVAGALKAEKLIFLTDVEGILEDPSRPETLIPTITIEKIKRMLQEGKIQKGMIAKVKACQKALEKGVKKVHIISGKIPRSLLLEIFTDSGIGTQIIP
ncbi:acetylglutamate kinase [Candidatus Aerophobetes bacterium]|uniref:Acetylglutamate kinase n=1 Tax=Aerophobetes bacterium TaxID=2030807 RepID=A0A7V5M019_UNCAE|nr:acetylglutamate kinase [Candidatus Aerophobetes bacterium]HHF98339.1 acetylglutamate kinase [Candidatus Aerophobetes bacterium]